MRISPRPTCTTMLRAISEIAVAMSVPSVREKPSLVARARASARAGTRSSPDPISTRTSSATLVVPPCPAVQERERLGQVERGVEGVQVKVELDHRDGHLGLD